MVKVEIKHLTFDNKLSYGIEVTVMENNLLKKQFAIPVVDVRDGDEARLLAKNMSKSGNHSKYMQPSFSVIGRSYQQSWK